MKPESAEPSVVISVAYDPDRETLDVAFELGWVCRYFAVVPLMYARLMQAKSLSLFFDVAIRDAKPFRRIA